jgi:subtilisin family serine protease
MPDLVTDRVVSRPLADRMAQVSAQTPIGVVIELRTTHPDGVDGARRDVTDMIAQLAPSAPVRAARSYVSTALTAEQIAALIAGAHPAADAPPRRPDPTTHTVAPRWAIYRIWPNFEVSPLIHRTVVTTKCDAAHRAFDAAGAGVVWAVLDSGVQADHPHFELHHNLDLPGGLQHRSFLPDTKDDDALLDAHGHGTHVAGILAGELQATAERPVVAATWFQDEAGSMVAQRLPLDRISGMAPRTSVMSCKVLRDDGSGDVAALLEALEYLQDINRGGRELNVHGINLSVGYPFDPSWFGAGLTPVCREVDRLVRSGVVVVIAAGNTGYGIAAAQDGRPMRLPFEMTINDPGNTDSAITVGSTSTRPHVTGVSYFSSKGPTGDGRRKPDLVAPGERVVSAAAGELLQRARGQYPEAWYAENSGTSMSAPHVSGVVAAFLSVHPEYLGKPDDVKEILTRTAGDLGRQRNFQGHGVVDAMRAIQSV